MAERITLDDLVVNLQAVVDSSKVDAFKQLEKFKKDLDVNPVYAMEWSAAMFDAAAYIEEAEIAGRTIASLESKSGVRPDDVLELVVKSMSQLGLTSMSCHSLPTVNLMNQARAGIATRWLKCHVAKSSMFECPMYYAFDRLIGQYLEQDES